MSPNKPYRSPRARSRAAPRGRRLLHFLLLGAALWCAQQFWQDWQYRIVSAPSPEQQQALFAAWARQHGRQPQPAMRTALIQQELDRRMLLREALRLKLHLRDPVVLRRLLQDARFLGLEGEPLELIQSALDMQLYHGDELIRRRLIERIQALHTPPMEPPDDARLQALAAELQTQPMVLDLQQHYFRVESDEGEQARGRAREVLIRLQQPDSATDSSTLGDGFLLGHHFTAIDPEQIDTLFGLGFSEQLDLDLIDVWQGPIRSRYGWHLLRLRRSATLAPQDVAARRQALIRHWRAQQTRLARQAYLTRLRQRYRILHG